MTESNYAFIKNNKVVNIVVFDNPSNKLLQDFKEVHNVDAIVDTKGDIKAALNATYDGIRFTLPQPFPSWILTEENNWEPPTPYPNDGKLYVWNEDALAWKEYTPVL